MSVNPLSAIFSSVNEDDLRKKVVEQLLDENNLEAKTELKQPLRWSVLKSIQEYIQEKGLKNSSLIVSSFLKTAFSYLISNDRKGRNEYIEALKALSNSFNRESNPIQQNKLGI